jgi:hypothetical protein
VKLKAVVGYLHQELEIYHGASIHLDQIHAKILILIGQEDLDLMMHFML